MVFMSDEFWMFSPLILVGKNIIFAYNFVAPLKVH